MGNTRARVQLGENHHMFPMEVVNPYHEIGDAMLTAQRMGGAALEVAQTELLEDDQWRQVVQAEVLPTMFDI